MSKKRIKKIIDDSGLKINYVADLLGITRQTLNTWSKEDENDQYKTVVSKLIDNFKFKYEEYSGNALPNFVSEKTSTYTVNLSEDSECKKELELANKEIIRLQSIIIELQTK